MELILVAIVYIIGFICIQIMKKINEECFLYKVWVGIVEALITFLYVVYKFWS